MWHVAARFCLQDFHCCPWVARSNFRRLLAAAFRKDDVSSLPLPHVCHVNAEPGKDLQVKVKIDLRWLISTFCLPTFYSGDCERLQRVDCECNLTGAEANTAIFRHVFPFQVCLGDVQFGVSS
jgi:hypothetical protein